jgi:hypothetical protein
MMRTVSTGPDLFYIRMTGFITNRQPHGTHTSIAL